MPDIMDEVSEMSSLMTASRYGFSAVGFDSLGASEYTLATIVVDISGSVDGWEDKLEDCLKAILKSCQSSPRSDNLLLRLVRFNSSVTEIHGFRLLNDIDESEYEGSLRPGGCTALFDASHTSIEATGDYGKLLVDQEDMSANGVVYIITDGQDNASKNTPKMVGKAIIAIIHEEKLDSFAAILIGVGYSDTITATYLDNFKDEADINQFVDLSELFASGSPEKALAKLAGYVSKSISSTSLALASGSTSASSSLLTF